MNAKPAVGFPGLEADVNRRDAFPSAERRKTEGRWKAILPFG